MLNMIAYCMGLAVLVFNKGISSYNIWLLVYVACTFALSTALFTTLKGTLAAVAVLVIISVSVLAPFNVLYRSNDAVCGHINVAGFD